MYLTKVKQSILFTVLVSSTLTLLPFVLVLLSVDLISGFAFSLFIMGLLADLFTTKAAIKRGFKETNLLYRALKSRMSIDQFLVFSTISGIMIGIILLTVLRSPFIILLFATVSFIGPLSNSAVLATIPNTKVEKEI